MDFKENNKESNQNEHSSSSGTMDMSSGNKEKKGGMQTGDMLHHHHRQTLWTYWLVIVLGLWILLSPITFSYSKSIVMPSGGRQIWLALSERITILRWSDILSGIGLIVFGWRGLTPNRPGSLWICCFIGVWLNMAPLIFWSPTAASYLNDTLVGTLVIALTILIPGMPNMMAFMKKGPDIPPGWSYNPSSWPQRWSMMVLAFLGWVVSRYLSAFQLGYIDHVWDPFFGDSTMKVLNSEMSKSLPVSDAGLGALAYTFEFLMGWMGGQARWRTMPWMVTFFGILVIPLGLVHISLVISQPVIVGHWCTFCLVAAGIMLPMLPLEVDEVFAMGQFMVQAKRKGEKFWNVFWLGGTVEGGSADDRTPELIKLPQEKLNVVKASLWGMSFPFTLVLSMILGTGLMILPDVAGIGIKETASNICHIGGALVVVFSVISMGEVVRMLRLLNIPLGIFVAVSLWTSGSSTLFLTISGTIVGIATAILSIPRGLKTEQYGLWDKYIK